MQHYNEKDKRLYDKIAHKEISIIDLSEMKEDSKIFHREVFYPEEGRRFLHEAAIIAFKGRLFASWYSCPKIELEGYTPIVERRSTDGGKTWTAAKEICGDKSEKILYCPPVYHIEDDKLYMLINQMVGPDYMHALDLYALNEQTDEFELLWSKPIPFKINTNVVKMDNGKLLIPGRIGSMDGLPVTPAVLIADSGKIDSEYRLVKIQEDEYLSEEVKYVYPEISAIVKGNTIYMYCRNDGSNVPILYTSEDFGETWSKPIAHNIPFSNSKIYTGTLSNGRDYIIGNIYPERSKLAIFFTEPRGDIFTKGYILQDGYCESLGYGGSQWSYPCAYEAEGNLYVIYSAQSVDGRGAVLSVMPIDL